MTPPDPTYSTNSDEPETSRARLIAEVIALRADLAGVIKQAERVLDAEGVTVESVIVTRRERRSLTKTTRKRNI
jgi:hypothetical protein